MTISLLTPREQARLSKRAMIFQMIGEGKRNKDLPMVKGVIFQGDPRGATVKLVCHEPSLHDDWGREGVCVPHS